MSGTTEADLGQPAADPAAAPDPAAPPAPAAAPAADGGAPPAPAADETKPRVEPWEVRRIRQITARNAAMEAELASLRASQPKPDPAAAPTQADFATEVEKAAAQKVATESFVAACNDVARAGTAEFKDFNDTIAGLWAGIGGFKPALVEAAMEAGDAHKLLYKLGQNPEEAERIAGLSPARMGAALAKLASQPAAAAPPPPPQSGAPEPIRPLQRGGGSPEPRPDGTMAEYNAWYERQLKAKGRIS